MARRISIEIVGDTSSLERAFGRAARGAHKFDRELSRTTHGFLSYEKGAHSLRHAVTLTAGSFIGAAGLVEGFREATGAASSLDTQMTRTRVVFRRASGEVIRFSKNSAESLGLSRLEALKATTTFGSLLKGMHVVGRGAARMSESLTRVGVDLAELHNANPAEVLAAEQAAIAGRTRGLRKYGIVINDAQVKQEAYRLGLVKTTRDSGRARDAQLALNIANFRYGAAVKKHGASSVQAAQALLTVHRAQRSVNIELHGTKGSLSAAARAAAVYSLIMRGAADSHGAFRRSSHGLAEQQRILRAQLHDQEEILGAQLIPEVLSVTRATTKWLGSAENQARVQRDLHEAVAAAVGIFKTAATVIGGVNKVTGGLKNTVELLIGLKFASMAANMARSFGIIGGGAAVATGEVAGLSASLAGLSAIGPIAIPIIISIIYRKQISAGVSGASTAVLHGLGVNTSPSKEAAAGLHWEGGQLVWTDGVPYANRRTPPSAADKNRASMWMSEHGAFLAGNKIGAENRESRQPGAQTRAAARNAQARADQVARAATAAATSWLGGLTGGGGGGGGGGTAVDTVMARLQILLTRAQQTPGLRDDLQILNQEKQHLQQRLRASKGNLDLQQQLADVEGQIASAVTQEQDRLRGLVGGLFQGPVLAPSEEDIKRKLGVAGPNIGKLTADLAAENARFEAERRDINKLRKRGASDKLISELEDLGPGGAAQVHTLANATDQKLKAFFKQFQQREKLVANAVRVEMSANVVNVRAGRITQAGHQARTAQATRERARAAEHGVVQHNNITIVDSRDSERAARRTAAHLQRQAKSTTVQRRGRNPGMSGSSF